MYPGVVVVRGDEIILKGEEDAIRTLTGFFGQLIEVAKTGRAVTDRDFRRLLEKGTVARRNAARKRGGTSRWTATWCWWGVRATR